MYKNRDTLIKSASKTFGFYQTAGTEYPQLSPSLTSPTENRFVNEVHGLITTENIDQSRRNFMIFPYQVWDVGKTYTKGDLVVDSGSEFEYINSTPSAGNLTTDTAFWFFLDELNGYLHQKRFQATAKAIDTVFNDKKNRLKIKSIYDNIALFDGVANYQDLEVNNDLFVGLRFRMKYDRSLVTTIKKIGTQFSEVIGSLTLFLYHSSQQTPIATFNINHAKANSSVWTILTNDETNELRYLNDNYDSGGEFFLGYAQSDLGTAQALIKREIDWINGNGCKFCPSDSTNQWYRNFSKYMDVIGFTIPESTFTVGIDLFDPEAVTIQNANNFGLNIQMSNECDLTPFFLEHEHLLAEALNNVAGMEILRDMASNTRGANSLANQVSVEANKQLFQVDGVFGTVRDVTQASLKGLSFDFSSLQDDCLTCHNPVVSDGNSSYEIEIDNPLSI